MNARLPECRGAGPGRRLTAARPPASAPASKPRRPAPIHPGRAPGALVESLDFIGPTAPSWKRGLRTISNGRGPRDTYG
jgi:hypothetical protein